LETPGIIMADRPIFRPPPARGGQEVSRVLIADAHPLMRDGLATVLAALAERVEIRQADTLQAALAELDAHPDCALALLDLNLPDGEGVDALRRVHEAHPAIPIVVVSGITDHATVTAAIRGGAMGFVSKRSSPPVLLSALRLVLAGEVYVPPEVLRAQLLTPSRGTTHGAPAAVAERTPGSKDVDLTKRQLDVLALLVQGKPNKVICRELGLAEGTVKAHTAAIFRALRVSNRTEAGFAVSCLGLRLPAAVDAPHADRRPAALGRQLAVA
jgi:DNA-binding NarL/FixJ family response regulator